MFSFWLCPESNIYSPESWARLLTVSCSRYTSEPETPLLYSPT
jgi:hypothetical protein